MALRDLAEGNRFDLILSDFNMPRMTGAELCSRVRIREDCASTGFILMTGTAHPEDPFLRESGVDVVLAKPVSMEKLMEVIREVTGRRRSESSA